MPTGLRAEIFDEPAERGLLRIVSRDWQAAVRQLRDTPSGVSAARDNAQDPEDIFEGHVNDAISGVDAAPTTIAEADSNVFVPPIVSPQGYRDYQKNVLPTAGTLTFNHRQFFYYIQVNMRRPPGSTGPVSVAYVTLF